MKFKNLKEEHFKHFTHSKCEYFPCHPTENPDDFNCLFCYCPLYALGDQCGGNFIYNNDIKDCSHCLIPHSPKGYEYIGNKFHEISELASKNRNEKRPEASSAIKHEFIKIL